MLSAEHILLMLFVIESLQLRKNITEISKHIFRYEKWRKNSHISLNFYLMHWKSMFSSVQFSCSVMFDSLWPHESQHARPPCPSPSPGVHSNSHPLSQWCHPAISSSVVPFSSCPQSLPASRSFPTSQLFTSGGQGIGVSASASVLAMNTQGWSP